MKHWTQRAACRNKDPEMFFPEDPRNKRYEGQVKAAKAVCADCPVVAECKAFAVAHNAQGVWGGTTDEERKALREESAA